MPLLVHLLPENDTSVGDLRFQQSDLLARYLNFDSSRTFG